MNVPTRIYKTAPNSQTARTLSDPIPVNAGQDSWTRIRNYLEDIAQVYTIVLSGFREDTSTVRRRRRRRLKGIHSRPDTNRTGAEGLSFYYPRLLHCLGQMLAVMSLSQHRVSSSKTVRPRAPCGARCIGHAVSTWSAVCSEAPHSQFGQLPYIPVY